MPSSTAIVRRRRCRARQSPSGLQCTRAGGAGKKLTAEFAPPSLISSPPFERRPRQVEQPSVLYLRPDEPVVSHLLQDVRRPAGHAAAREHARKGVGLDAEREERGRGI